MLVRHSGEWGWKWTREGQRITQAACSLVVMHLRGDQSEGQYIRGHVHVSCCK